MSDEWRCKGHAGPYCAGLDRVMSPEPNRGAVRRLVTINLNDGTETVQGVVLAKTPRGKGIMMNVCPFCGADLDQNFSDR